jgi:hypothetical protein
MSTDNFQGNVFVAGTLQCNTFVCPAGSIADAGVASPSAGASGIQTSKLNHRYPITYNQPEGSAATSATVIAWIVKGTASVMIALDAALKVACIGAATITVDLKKNGTSVLTSVITFNNGTPIMTDESATIATAAGVAGDIFEIVVVATAGGGTLGQGLFVKALIDEFPS